MYDIKAPTSNFILCSDSQISWSLALFLSNPGFFLKVFLILIFPICVVRLVCILHLFKPFMHKSCFRGNFCIKYFKLPFNGDNTNLIVWNSCPILKPFVKSSTLALKYHLDTKAYCKCKNWVKTNQTFMRMMSLPIVSLINGQTWYNDRTLVDDMVSNGWLPTLQGSHSYLWHGKNLKFTKYVRMLG